jgi:tetratricopeptide (TPR) repeat protein
VVAIAEKDPVLSSKLDIPVGSLGDALEKQGRFDEAIEAQRRALAIAEQSKVAFRIATALESLAVAEQGARRDDAAVEHFGRAVELLKTFPEPNPYPGEPLTHLGLLYLERGESKKAEATLREAIAYYDKTLARDDLTTTSARIGLSRALLANGDRAGAETILKAQLEVLDKSAASAGKLAGYRFSLAKVMWDANLLRPRALELAQTAKGASPNSAQAEIDAWLAERASAR